MTDEIINLAVGAVLEQIGIGSMLQGFLMFFIWIGFFVSAIEAFFGYLLMRIWIVINGILNGFIIGVILGGIIGGILGEGDPEMLLGWVLFGLIAGPIIGGMIAYKVWKIGVFLLCFGICTMVAFVLGSLMVGNMTAGLIFGVIIGAIAGYYAVLFVKPVVILITAIGGGLTAGLTLFSISPVLGIICGIVCIFGGFYVQCTMNGNVFGIGTGKLAFQGAFYPTAEVGNEVKNKQSAENLVQENRAILKENNPLFVGQKNSKFRKDLTSYKIRVRNDREYVFPNAPLLIPQIQIADMSGEEQIGLYLSFQNIVENKRIIAVYCDIHCYNVLKEKITELKNISLLDLSIESGQVVSIDKPISLPDTTIRRCEIVPRHVVFSDDTIWSYEGENSFGLAPLQKESTIHDSEFKSEFAQLIRQKTIGKISDYLYEPMNFQDFWYCGCGQLNKGESCIFCKARRQDIFKIMDMEYLKIYHQETMEKREAEKLEREEARKKKIEDIQSQTKQMMGVASEKGKEVLAKSSEVGKKTVDSLKRQVEETKQKVEHKKREQEERKRATVRYCPECGTEYEENEHFCMNCGFQLSGEIGEEKVCSACNTVNVEDAKFCMKCGQEL